MKSFDWDVAKQIRTPRMYDYLVENYKKPITEDEYVKHVRLIKKLLRKQGVYSHFRSDKFAKKISGSQLKREYRTLKGYGFFTGESV